MPLVNDHYLTLAAGYFFPEIGRRVNAFSAEHPDLVARFAARGLAERRAGRL